MAIRTVISRSFCGIPPPQVAAAQYEYAHDRCRASYRLTSRVREQDPFEQSSTVSLAEGAAS